MRSSSAASGARLATLEELNRLGLVHGMFLHALESLYPLQSQALHSGARLLEPAMKIGDLSNASFTPIETIRFYEREGLLPPPARSQGNFRLYEEPHLERLQFIRYCRSLDMSLDEVRVLLRVKDDPSDQCGDVDALIDGHIVHVSKRIKELRLLEKQLKDLRQRGCGVQSTDQCGILNGLTGAAKESTPVGKGRTHLRALHSR